MAPKTKTTTTTMAAGSERELIVARYDRLLETLGEDPFRSTSVLQRAEDVVKVLDDTQTAAQRKKLLAAAAQKSLRCAELIEQALEASAALTHAQSKIAGALKQGQDSEDSGSDDDDDDDVDMDDSNNGDDGNKDAGGKTALLLEDLVAVGSEMQDASKKYAQLGVAGKTARASRALLSLADQSLHESADELAAAAGGGWDANGSSRVQEQFRDLYMDAFTTAFGDDLDAFRQEERFESRDVTYLISCIHAGADVFSPLQQKLFVESVSGASAASQ